MVLAPAAPRARRCICVEKRMRAASEVMRWRALRPVQLRSTLSAALIASLLLVSRVRADEAEVATSPGLFARHELWLSLSATLLTAGITGSYALKVAALSDRMDRLVLASTERPQLAQDVVNARRLAWGFGTAASLFAVTTVMVLVFQPGRQTEVAPVLGVGGMGVRYSGKF